jgi:immunity protein, SdpI family
MRKWLPALLILATLAFSIAAYTRLPERIPIHWNASGEPDDYGSRAFGAFLLPAVLVGLWGLLLALPKVDPRSANIEKFRDTYDVFVIAIVAVLCVLHIGVVGSALGWPVRVGRLTPASIGVLFLFLGALLPRFKSNFFFGIRTPWTLSSDTVWARTHQVGGYVVALMGLLLIGAGIIGTHRWFLVAIWGSMVLAIGLLVYSYLLWRGEQRPGT